MHTKTATVQVKAANMAGNVYACNVCFTDYIPTHLPSPLSGEYPHLVGLSLCQRAERIDLLIGQDHAALLMPLEVRAGPEGAPYAVRTPLGWTLHRSTACKSPQPVMCMLHSVICLRKCHRTISMLSSIGTQTLRQWTAIMRSLCPGLTPVSPRLKRGIWPRCDTMPYVYVSMFSQRSS